MRLFITLPADVAEAAQGASGRPEAISVLTRWDGEETAEVDAAMWLEGPLLVFAIIVPDPSRTA